MTSLGLSRDRFNRRARHDIWSKLPKSLTSVIRTSRLQAHSLLPLIQSSMF